MSTQCCPKRPLHRIRICIVKNTIKEKSAAVKPYSHFIHPVFYLIEVGRLPFCYSDIARCGLPCKRNNGR